MPKIIFTFPEEDDAIFSSAFVIGFPLRSQRSTAPSEATPSQPQHWEVDEAPRATGTSDAPEDRD